MQRRGVFLQSHRFPNATAHIIPNDYCTKCIANILPNDNPNPHTNNLSNIYGRDSSSYESTFYICAHHIPDVDTDKITICITFKYV